MWRRRAQAFFVCDLVVFALDLTHWIVVLPSFRPNSLPFILFPPRIILPENPKKFLLPGTE